MIKKNMLVDIEITGLNSEGSGVGRFENFAIFVPLTVPGDFVKIKITKALKSYGFGIIEKIIKPTEHRIKIDCPIFIKCGGCSYRHMDYKTETEQKKSEIEYNFKKIGSAQSIDLKSIDLQCEEIISGEKDRYRNKALFPVSISAETLSAETLSAETLSAENLSAEKGKIIAGFYAKRTHRVISCNDCLLQPEKFSEILKDILFFANQYKISPYNEENSTGLLRHIFLRYGEKTNQIMVCLVLTSFDLPFKNNFIKGLTKKYSEIKSIVLCKNEENTNVIMGKETLTIFGNDFIEDELCGLKLKISALSFYQVNRTMAEKLYKIVDEFADLTGTETIIDLYCGAGTIGLSLAKKAKKIIGVEIIPKAIEDANENARQNNIENAEFICSDAKKAAQKLADDKISPNIIIVDPPRQGCDNDCIKEIIKMSPQKIIMVSCNSATAARDCKILETNGYEIKRIKAIDLFPRTTHVETVVLLTHKDE